MSPRAVVALFCRSGVDAFLPTLASLAERAPGVPIVLGCPKPEAAREALVDWPGAEIVEAWSLGTTVRLTASAHRTHVLAVSAPVIFPPDFLEPALDLVDADLRVATVSFLSNAAGYLSIPHRNREMGHPTGRHDEVSLTRALRETEPHIEPAIIPVAAGPAVLVSWTVLSAVGGMAEVESAAETLGAYSLRCQQRGFVSVLHPSTFVLRPVDLAPLESDVLQHSDLTRHGLQAEYPWFPSGFDDARTSQQSPVALALQTAVAKTEGIRVFIDGTCLGPQEMGTQVQTLAVIHALASSNDVHSVGVALPGPLPRYADTVLRHPKVAVTVSAEPDFSSLGKADVVHRPFQPDRPLPFEGWAECSHRAVVTVQDLIAYQIGGYQPSGAQWLVYREHLRRAVAEADGLVVISHDTKRQVALERLPIDSDRVFVVENGTDHLRGDEPDEMPTELLSRRFSAGEFILVLGANYAHKNRDFALAAWQGVLNRQIKQSLVMVGAAVPHGSSRRLEAAHRLTADDDVFFLPDVNDRERNWLLRHATVVLYPTSAEGFGLVPFEAARFGTPTVMVPFGPLREVNESLPVTAASWAADHLADAVAALLKDPALAQAQVDAVLASSARYSWEHTAAGLVRAYRSVLSQPSRQLR